MMTMALKVETQQLLLIILFILYSIGQITGVHITDLQVPAVALEGDPIHLSCNYEDETGSSLYTLKWYKDDQEFYRHQPGISPHTTDDRCKDLHTYAVQGVDVDCWVSTEREVVLLDATRRTSGEYQCEVIGEHPKFRKEVRKSRLTVFSEPLLAPLIVGAEDSYSPSEYVALNCSSVKQDYVPGLSWFINGHPAHQNYLYQYDHRTLGLLFQARSDLFERGMISVSCISTFGDYHRKSTKKQLRSRNYLTAEEYQFNAGERKDLSLKMVVVVMAVSAMLGLRPPSV